MPLQRAFGMTPIAPAAGFRARLRARAAALLTEFDVLRRAAADPRAPRSVRWVMRVTALYVISPIDLIPDFIPVIGQLDELLLVPLALGWVRRRLPPELLAEHRARLAAPPA